MRHAVLLLASLLTACAGQPVPPPAPPPEPEPPRRDIVAEIHAEARRDPSTIEVHPLTDDNVVDLIEEARRRWREGLPETAGEPLERALALRPEDPRLWQFMAEIKVRLRDFPAAETLALKSFNLGPRVGELCLRNWHTVAAARTERGDADGAAQARERSESCRVRARPRW